MGDGWHTVVGDEVIEILTVQCILCHAEHIDTFQLDAAFQVAGLILLVAMIGAIVLTLRHRDGVRKQDVWAQMQRDPKTAVELKDVRPGQSL